MKLTEPGQLPNVADALEKAAERDPAILRGHEKTRLLVKSVTVPAALPPGSVTSQNRCPAGRGRGC